MLSKKLDRAEVQPIAAPSGSVVDPVCGMSVLAASAAASTEFAGQRYWFCSAHCQASFLADAPRHAKGAVAAQPCPEHAATEHGHPPAPTASSSTAPGDKQLAVGADGKLTHPAD